jgi:hypothetical protein
MTSAPKAGSSGCYEHLGWFAETRNDAAETGLTKSTLTGVSQTLEARGLIVREIPASDRRRTLLSLSGDGDPLNRKAVRRVRLRRRSRRGGELHNIRTG